VRRAAVAHATNHQRMGGVNPNAAAIGLRSAGSCGHDRASDGDGERALHCTSMEAEQLLQKARDAGKTTVWQGPWHKAEEIRQTLEAEDLLAEVEQVGAD
jgi:hypothetical protein